MVAVDVVRQTTTVSGFDGGVDVERGTPFTIMMGMDVVYTEIDIMDGHLTDGRSSLDLTVCGNVTNYFR